MVNPMDVYNKIKRYPQAKAEADAFMQSLTKKYTEDKPAPPELIQKGLEGILAKYEDQKSSAPISSTVPSKSTESDYNRIYSFFEGIGSLFSNPYLATASVAALALLSIGVPYIPP